MKKRRLLVTGGSGLLALNWACALRDSWAVTLGTHQHSVTLAGVDSLPLSLDDPARLLSEFRGLSPDLVVHTAGLTSVDRCELFPQQAHQANVEIARNVAHTSAACSAALVHISTDHIFTGFRSMSVETEPPEPVNHYGRTKALAETAVMQAHPGALVVRTNFFGWGHASRQSFTDWLIYSLRGGKMLSLFDNVFFTPILADELALASHDLVTRGASGVFNLVGDQRLSKYEFACMVASEFSLPMDLLIQHSLVGSELVAARPNDMSLSNEKAQAILGRSLGNAHRFLYALRQQELAGRATELLRAVEQKSRTDSM
ncbi:MAG: SDR family oxidoreductase [Pseudomonadota bacterium]